MTDRILLKTTISAMPDNWNVGRFSLLLAHLASLRHGSAQAYEVLAHDRIESATGDDLDLELLVTGRFDQLWLIAADDSGTLSDRDVEHITEFRARGGGIFMTRDHQNLGASLIRLGALGETHHFQTFNPDPDPMRQFCDDKDTPTISWPNFHSGANGDLQRICVAAPLHPLMRRSDGTPIQYLPAHPHEGTVGVPTALAEAARVVATGKSLATGAIFNLCVAVQEGYFGRAVADSSFHHLCDYNWDPRMGAPSFVTEPVGESMQHESAAILDTHRYVENIAAWLGGRI